MPLESRASPRPRPCAAKRLFAVRRNDVSDGAKDFPFRGRNDCLLGLLITLPLDANWPLGFFVAGLGAVEVMKVILELD